MFADSVDSLLRRWTMAVDIANEARSVAEAAKKTGLGRSEIYNALWAWQEGGAPALRARAERSVRRRPHYVVAVEREATRLSLENPTWGRKRLSKSLAERGYPASPSRVRRVLALQPRAGLPTSQGPR